MNGGAIASAPSSEKKMNAEELRRREKEFEDATAGTNGKFDKNEKKVYQVDYAKYYSFLDAKRDHTGSGVNKPMRTFDEGAAAAARIAMQGGFTDGPAYDNDGQDGGGRREESRSRERSRSRRRA